MASLIASVYVRLLFSSVVGVSRTRNWPSLSVSVVIETGAACDVSLAITRKFAVFTAAASSASVNVMVIGELGATLFAVFGGSMLTTRGPVASSLTFGAG